MQNGDKESRGNSYSDCRQVVHHCGKQPGIGFYVMATKLRIGFGTVTTRKRLYNGRQMALKIASSDFNKSYAKLKTMQTCFS